MNPPPRANSAAARDIANVLHPNTDLKMHLETGPIVITRGEGVRVFDDTGKGYIEAVAGLWCASLGFSNERLVEAAAKQMRQLPYYHGFTSKSHGPMIDLAEMLIERAPVKMSKVFFANSGSEANDTAIKMVWYFNNAIGRPNKKKIIGRIKGYHGITVASASLTGLATNHRSFDVPLDRFVHTMTPHFYHGGVDGETEEEFATRCADELEKLILKEGPDTVAAMWAEPVMGAGGVIVPPKGYFEKIQAVLTKYDVLLVADEVITGFWRTGNYWGSGTLNVKPDILTCAKAISSSYLPISAVMINDRIFRALADESHAIGTFGHGYTYSGHPVPAAVALETLKIYRERDIASVVRGLSPALLDGLHRCFDGHPMVGDVRGVGLIAGVELARDPAAKTAFDPALGVAARVVRRAQELGAILRPVPGDVVAFCPPFVIDEATIGLMLDRFGQALDETHAALKAEGAA
jgi:4-aminobutyrate--pyruvate transaminase